jgi:hypothetical protein
MSREEKLDQWIDNRLNVMFIGQAGVGKTSIVLDAFERKGLKWKYFSASTLDPWVDFIGVPRTVEKDGVTYLDLVRPKEFANDEIEALFFDEYNRAPKKIRNAVMELIQFKSINGKKFNNLKIIWTAINPDDDEEQYDVEKLDRAQMDRFHVHLEIPYEPDSQYFCKKYGSRIATSAISWWKDLPAEHKKLVSPRRLDYALDFWRNKGQIRDILTTAVNPAKLLHNISQGPIIEELEKLFTSKNEAETRKFLKNENNFDAAVKYIDESETFMDYFLPLMTSEKINKLISEEKKISNFILNNPFKYKVFESACREIIESDANGKLAKKIRTRLTNNKAVTASNIKSNDKYAVFYNIQKTNEDYDEFLARIKSNVEGNQNSTLKNKTDIYKEIEANFPANLSYTTAITTLIYLNSMYGNFYTSTFLFSADYKNIAGIINHCINSIIEQIANDFSILKSNNTVKNLDDFQKYTGRKLQSLFDKFTAAGRWEEIKQSW